MVDNILRGKARRNAIGRIHYRLRTLGIVIKRVVVKAPEAYTAKAFDFELKSRIMAMHHVHRLLREWTCKKLMVVASKGKRWIEECSHVDVAADTCWDTVLSDHANLKAALNGKHMVKLDGNWLLEKRANLNVRCEQRHAFVKDTLKKLNLYDPSMLFMGGKNVVEEIVHEVGLHVAVEKAEKQMQESDSLYQCEVEKLFNVHSDNSKAAPSISYSMCFNPRSRIPYLDSRRLKVACGNKEFVFARDDKDRTAVWCVAKETLMCMAVIFSILCIGWSVTCRPIESLLKEYLQITRLVVDQWLWTFLGFEQMTVASLPSMYVLIKSKCYLGGRE